jgi:hypothetical protein
MHDIDPSKNEFIEELDALESDEGSAFEFTLEDEDAPELLEAADGESPLSEEEEMEYAAELLEITTEDELDQFLGKLVKRAWGGIKKFARSKVGRAIGGALKKVAKVALPVAGKVLGGMVGGPVGGMIGGKLASAAGKAFGLELDGMSAEDQEFEIARRFVRLAAATARNAASAPASAEPGTVVRSALLQAARQHAPGLLGRLRGGAAGSAAASPLAAAAGRASVGSGRISGRWVRRGNKIIILGI